MSILVGMLGSNYTVVAADTRGTSTIKHEVDDNAKKSFMYDRGFVGNSGGVVLETGLFERCLNSIRIKSRKDIYTAWLRSFKQVEQFCKEYLVQEEFKAVKAHLPSSQAFYSLNYFKDGIPHMSLEGMDFAHKARKVQGINSLVVNPPKYTRRINKAVKKYTRLTKRSKGLDNSIYLIACLIDDISKLTDWINNTIEYGISLKISESEILLMSIRENAKKIKHIYKKTKDYSNLMMVRKVIKNDKISRPVSCGL